MVSSLALVLHFVVAATLTGIAIMAALVGGASTGPSFTAAAVGEFLSGELGYSGGDNSHSK